LRPLFPVAAAVGALLVAAAPAAPADLKPLTFEALRGLVTVREPQIAPDGKRIVYVRATGDYKADRTDTELILIDVPSGARRVLTHDRIGVHAPRWSPSGDRIAYLASPARSKPAQLYVLPMSGGDSEKITDVKGGVGSYDWRPDGNAFAYLAKDDPPKTKVPEDYVPAFPVTDEHFLTREPSRPSHAWTIGADGKGAKQITKGELTPADGAELRCCPTEPRSS
jgi:dipeptidyl aminopeptidase/acylaminoacyl peptidase